MKGTYICSGCGNQLFDAEKKFEAGTGFPSFWMSYEKNVRQQFLNTYGRERIQLVCNSCELHLGHLFQDKRTPSSFRFCIVSDSIRLGENKEFVAGI